MYVYICNYMYKYMYMWFRDKPQYFGLFMGLDMFGSSWPTTCHDMYRPGLACGVGILPAIALTLALEIHGNSTR